MRLFLAFVALLGALLWGAHPARAQVCEESVQAWARGCPAIQALCLHTVLCPAGGVVLEVGCAPADRLRVEVTAESPRAFRNVGPVGLSPVGQFPNWQQAPAEKRRLFALVESCIAADPSLVAPRAGPGASALAGSSAGSASGAHEARSAPVPWRLVLAWSLAILVGVHRWRSLRDRRIVALLGALVFGTLLLRWAAIPMTFYHPNGQGPFWIGFALDEHGDRASYGPGYWEMFAWIARLPCSTPERLVFGAQAILGAFSAACAWVITREMGGRRPLAWGAAALVAASPLLARMSQSQSYYGTWTSMLFLATAILVLGCPREGMSRRVSLLAVVSAGLFVAQAARVTPIGWMAAAVLPLSVLSKPGPLRVRLGWTALSGLGIALVVALTSGPAMLGVLRGSLGAQWLPLVNPGGIALLGSFGPARLFLMALVFGGAVHLSERRAHAAVRMGALFGVVALMDVTCMVRGDTATFQRAFMAMWSPVLLALAVSVVAGLRAEAARAAVSIGSLIAVVVVHAVTWREDREVPTNALEAAWAEEWRAQLPDGATVVYVSRAGQDVLGLPLYAGARVKGEPFHLSSDDDVPDMTSSRGAVFYYESSLCAAPEAQPLCRRLHERFAHTLIATRTLPARASRATSFFEGTTVQVSLYDVREPPREP